MTTTNNAQETNGAPAINIVFPENSAKEIASSLQRNGIIVGIVGASSVVLTTLGLLLTLHALSADETAHSLCAYEFNRFTSELEAKGNSAQVLQALQFAGCNRKKDNLHVWR